MNPIAYRSRCHRWAFLVLMGLMAACSPKPTIATPNASAEEIYNSPDDSFSTRVPRNWTKSEGGHPYGDLTSISGVKLTGPADPAGVPVTISVLHYSGEHVFRTPEEFIHNTLNSIVRADHERETPIDNIQVAGRPGKTFALRTFELVYLPTQSALPMQDGVVYEIVPPHKQVDMVERYIVVPASLGYFVLGYRAPATLVGSYRGMFEGVVGSFRSHLP